MSDLTRNEIQDLIELYGFEEILLQFNITPWKALELLDELSYINLEDMQENGY